MRFHPKSDPTRILLGQPADPALDVGQAVRAGHDVAVQLCAGTSVLAPGPLTGATETIARLLSPLAAAEVGTIRCIGLNVRAAAPARDAR